MAAADRLVRRLERTVTVNIILSRREKIRAAAEHSRASRGDDRFASRGECRYYYRIDTSHANLKTVYVTGGTLIALSLKEVNWHCVMKATSDNRRVHGGCAIHCASIIVVTDSIMR